MMGLKSLVASLFTKRKAILIELESSSHLPVVRGMRPQRAGGVQNRLRGLPVAIRRCDLGRRLITCSLQGRDGRVGISDGQKRVHSRGVCVGSSAVATR